MELTDAPWVGLLWDDTNRRMITASPNQKVAKQLLFYFIGGDLQRMKTSKRDLRREYAGLLNKMESDARLDILLRIATRKPSKKLLNKMESDARLD